MVRIGSYTSRRNARPVSSVVLLWDGPDDSRITVVYHGHRDQQDFSGEFTRAKHYLHESDHLEAAWDALSAPKLKLHALACRSSCELSMECEDAGPRNGDSYLVRVMLANGEVAWSSPIWYGEA